MEVLTKKYHGLPGYAWIGVIAASAFIYFRLRSGSSSSSSDGLPAGDNGSDPSVGAQGFGQGFEQGFGQGMYAGQIQPKPSPAPGTDNCRTMRDPSGKAQTVCGPGAFQATGTTLHPTYKWVKGATRTIYGRGLKGTPFYSLRAWHMAQARRNTHGGKSGTIKTTSQKGNKPVKQQPRIAA